ncbi:MAG: peptidase M48 [Candidatus Marinimicrobia bacterium]|nr:peptidase M48 [Candidatus Neomarinimicrobiota bacterium]|tara:strand:+ start:12440 stop:13273 length:834 start_codon:yes stop_codon:yes gene_type:complete
MKNSYTISRRKFLELFGGSCCGLLASCSTVPITDRKQLTIYPESFVNKQAAGAYNNFKSKAKLIKKGKELNNIIEIGQKIEKSVTSFFLKKDGVDPTENFEWEYILVNNDKVKNAWCMPGGKIAVYTGILKVAENNSGLSTIMGHEIAHAVAKHSVERMSQAMAVNLGTQVADIFLGGAINRTRNTVGRATGMDIFQLGVMNPFGRKQETEADYLGLIFSSLSGFNITESYKLWERMQKANKGKEPPQFLSTHPSSQNRIENLKNWINKIILEYPPV